MLQSPNVLNHSCILNGNMVDLENREYVFIVVQILDMTKPKETHMEDLKGDF